MGSPTVQGMILAAGRSSRLYPLSRFRAKPAVPILNRPLILYSLDLLQTAGVRDVVVNLHHLADTVREAVGGAEAEVRFSCEESILGTAGALAEVRDSIEADDLIVSNGKTVFEQDMVPALEFHRRSEAWATLLLVPFVEDEGYNPAYMDNDDSITGFGSPDPNWPRPQKGYVFTGIHILSRRALDAIPRGFSDSVKDVWPGWIASGRPVKGFVSSSFWCENSLSGRYLRNSMELLSRRGLDNLGLPPDARSDCLRVVAGNGVRLGSGCRLRDCVFWEDVSVGDGVRLENVIVSDGVDLGDGLELRDSIVTPLFDTGSGSGANGSGGASERFKVFERFILWPIRDFRE